MRKIEKGLGGGNEMKSNKEFLAKWLNLRHCFNKYLFSNNLAKLLSLSILVYGLSILVYLPDKLNIKIDKNLV